jgi:hypothetical protein
MLVKAESVLVKAARVLEKALSYMPLPLDTDRR